MLKGKHILFISPSFFNYEKALVNAMEENGAQVDFFDERPSNSFWTKGLVRVNPNLIEKKIENYYQQILNQARIKTYDYFLLIKGESIPYSFLEAFTKEQAQAKRIFYMYDSFAEYPKFEKLLPYFHKNISFEYRDTKAYNLQFRPLFYLEDYEQEPREREKEYDFCFIGSAHTDRYLVGEKLRKEAEKLNLKAFLYYYAPSKMMFYLKRLFDKNLKAFDVKKLSYEKLSHSDILEIYAQSKAVLDINKPFQFGLSMRSFEALVSGNKLITTNHEIKEYEFYSPERILVIDREKPVLEAAFFESEFIPLTSEEKSYLSINQWLEDVFLNEEIDFPMRENR